MRRGAAALAIAVALPSIAAARETTAADHAAELRRLAEAISTVAPDEAPHLARTIPTVWVVERPGQRFEIPADWVRRQLRDGSNDPTRWPAARERLVQRLSAMAAEAERLAGGGMAVDAGEARAALERVLAAPEFRRLATRSAFDRLRERVSAFILRLLRRIGGGGLATREVALFLAWTASLSALALLSAWLLRTLRARGGGGLAPVPLSGPTPLSARGWAARARAAADAREAVRCAYRAAVHRLEEQGTWQVDESRTPREYRRLLPRAHPGRPAVEDVTARFEEIWYGAREATDEDRRTLVARLRELGCVPAD